MKLTLNDLWMIVDNMVRMRLAIIRMLAMGALFEMRLLSLHARLAAHPSVRQTGRPFAAELATEDSEHDFYGRALDALLIFYELLAPALTAQTNQHVATLRRQMMTGAHELKDGYVLEASRAKRRRPLLDTHSDALNALPIADLDTALTLATRFIAHGENIDNHLQDRADVNTTEMEHGGALRSEAQALFNDIRQATQAQLRGEKLLPALQQPQPDAPPRLPGNTETRIFAYYDTVLQLRASGNTEVFPTDDLAINPPQPTPTTPPTPSDPAQPVPPVDPSNP